jgi:tripartite-type tricarboxylate transporter receptor subunit TctC
MRRRTTPAARAKTLGFAGPLGLTGSLGLAGMLGLAGTLGLAGSAAAQGYPDHLVSIVVPSTAGSSADILGRVLADGMAPKLGGERLVVMDKPGGGGILGTADVARAKPDGYTLMHGAIYSITVRPLVEPSAGYSAKSFEPICQTFKNDQVIVARKGTYKTLADIMKASKAKPGGLNYGSPGVSTIPHLSMAGLSKLSKVPFNHVPFKGPAESLSMTIGGHVDFDVSPLTAAAKSGLTMVALFAEKRNHSIPNVPTVKESGYDIAPLSIGGLLAPAGIPADIKKKLEAACIAARDTEAFQRVVKNTFQPDDYFADAAGFKANLEKDVAAKRKLVTSLGMAKTKTK